MAAKFYRVDGEIILVNYKCAQPPGFPCILVDNPERKDCTKCPQCMATLYANDLLKIIEKVEA